MDEDYFNDNNNISNVQIMNNVGLLDRGKLGRKIRGKRFERSEQQEEEADSLERSNRFLFNRYGDNKNLTPFWTSCGNWNQPDFCTSYPLRKITKGNCNVFESQMVELGNISNMFNHVCHFPSLYDY